MTDPVAAKSAFLSMYMSNHPDTLVAYVMQHIKNRQVATASMTSIDSKAMTLAYTIKGSDAKTTVQVPFDPPLLGYEEVKPRLMSMKVDAEVDLGMAKNPIITQFEVPLRNMMPVLTLQILQAWTTWSHASYAESLRQFLGWQMIIFSWVILVTFHVGESVYILYLCSKHKTPFSTKLLWFISTFLFGYPFIIRYLGFVKEARIDSVMKGS